MSMLPPVVGRLIGDNSAYIKSLNEAETATKGSTDKSASHFGKLGGQIEKAMKVGAAAGGVAVAGFFTKAVMGASDLAETMSKVGVVFGDQASQVTSFANQMAKDFGLPKGAILDAASSIGLIGKASGLSQGDAAKMSTQLGKLAADASSFYNVPLPEALQAIQSGLVGEAEPMRRFGVLLNEQAVTAEAARMGLQKVNGEYTEGAKAQARASLIMAGMKDASGDLERTQGSLSNRMRELKGRAENFATSVGTAVVPMVLKLMDAGENLGKKLGPAFSYIAEVAGFIGPAFMSAFSGEGVTSDGIVGVAERVGVALRAIVDWVKDNWPEIKKIITETMKTVHAVIKGVVEVISTIWENFGDQIMNVIAAAWASVKSTIKAALDVIQGIVKVVTGIMKGDWSQVWDGIKQILAGAWEFITGKVQFAIDIVKNIISVGLEIIGLAWSGAWNGIKDFFAGIWDSVFQVARNAVAGIVDIFLGMVGLILGAAERAFGWIPGIGGKIKDAARAFEEFRDRTNAALRGTDSEKTINVYHNNYHRDYYETIRGQPGNFGAQDVMHGGGIVRGRTGADVPILAQAGEGVFTRSQMAVLGASMGTLGGRGAPAGGNTYVVQVYSATGDIPDETIRKIRTQLFEMENDMPSGQVLPTAS